MERKHLRKINVGRKRQKKAGRITASCDWMDFTYGKSVETPTLKAEDRKVAQKQRKVA